jgi:uncharacterized membrane protein YgcG
MIENIQAVLVAVLNFVRVELKARIALFLERAVQALRDRTYTSFSASQQSRAAERWLAHGQSELETALHQRLADSFTRQAIPKEVAPDELQLLDDDSLNVVMLRARLVSSVMDKARESVVALEVRLEALKQAGAQINTRAFTPGAIADGFMETLKRLDVPPEVQIVLMEAYSERGADMLTGFYKDLNDLLISHNVMPGFKYSTIKSFPSKPRPGSQSGGAGGSGGSGSGGGFSQQGAGAGTGGGGSAQGAGARTGDTKGGMDWAPPWPAVSAGASIPADFAQLLDAKLTAMQQALAHLTAESWQPGTLRDTFSIPPPISLSPEQEESIDHIEAVFLDLIRDTRISARFRSELNRLILPLMSLRLSDADLFKNPENPVRRFIRQLALLGFRDKELPIDEFEHISLVVGRIVSERAQEIASFNSGADALYTIARNEVRRQLEARQHSRKPEPSTEQKSEITQERVSQSHRFVQSALRTMSAGLHPPMVVQHFVLRLLAPWMMVAYQRHGEDSDETRDCVLFASTFFDLLEPAGSADEHQRKILLRRQTLEQIALETLRARSQEKEMVVLLEGVAAYFDELNLNPTAGLTRDRQSSDESFVSYLDDLTVTRAAP